MANEFTRTSAFAALGTTLLDRMRDWSARSDDGSIVALSIWRDEFDGRAGAMVYEKLDTSDWRDGRGKERFFAELRRALDRCGGLVRIVVSVRDPNNAGRAKECYPAPRLLMRVTYLDVEERGFRLEQVVSEAEAA